MRPVFLLATLAALALPAQAGARQPLLFRMPEPLGVLVRESKTIHVLRIQTVGKDRANVKPVSALKGASAPVRILEVGGDWPEGAFRPGSTALFFSGDKGALLFADWGWAFALDEKKQHEKAWLCVPNPGRWHALVYEGTAEALREHVVAILAGRERVITARAPQRWGDAGGPRLWRIKAGLKITDFALSEESPHFVGWGTGDPDEVTKLSRALRAAASDDRCAAAGDLAHLGPAARPALPDLRRALRDPAPAVRVAAAVALARLCPAEETPIEALVALLRHDHPTVRATAADALGGLGGRARAALPALLPMLKGSDEWARDAAVAAVGRVAPGSSLQGEAVAALAGLLKVEKGPALRAAAVEALRDLGPHVWKALPQLREWAIIPGPDPAWYEADARMVALVGRLSPPPVELLAGLTAEGRMTARGREAAARELAALGHRARLTFSSLLRVWAEQQEDRDDVPRPLELEAAAALLAVGPEDAPELLVSRLVTLAQRPAPPRYLPIRLPRQSPIDLLGKCGRTARPALPALVEALGRKGALTPKTLRGLAPLLCPEDEKRGSSRWTRQVEG